jgi:two-component system, chemotaxis family, sensor kinase CheA
MGREQLRAIFIEEAGEIIEKLDGDIIDFEQDSTNKEILNALFRGVHTLKGNSNAFGFTRLGGFVHHFEDLLDHYRLPNVVVPANAIDVLLNGVDVIKEVMNYEINGDEGLPEQYEQCLQGIIGLLNLKDEEGSVPKPTLSLVAPAAPMLNLADEFIDDNSAKAQSELGECEKYFDSALDTTVSKLLETLEDGATLYKIELTLDNDIYFRGYDHVTFLRLLTEVGAIKESFWECDKIPPLEGFDAQNCYFGRVAVLLESKKSEEDIAEIFEFLFDNEYKITKLLAEAKQTSKLLETATIASKQEESSTPNEIEHPIRRKEDKEAVATQKSYIKIDTQKLDELFDTVGELVIAQNYIAQNEKIRDLGDSDIHKTIETLTKITRLIQDRVMSLRMVAVRDTFEKMKRVARDTAKKTGKELKLNIQGEETEIDKTMIDSLSDPMVHLIRNAIDHGLEATPEDRINAGKEAEGAITLRAYHKSGNIIISITDDGRGINKQKVIDKAIATGVISSAEGLSEAQIFSLLLAPGFSTAASISDISGRGVGLDVVKTSIEKLRGKIDIASEEGKGSTFSIILPLTLAIIDGMLVKSSNDIFIIPTLSVVESFRPDKDIVHMLKGKGEFVDLRGEHIPVIRLSELLGLDDAVRPEIWESTLVCIETDRGRYAILVDELMGRQQVVIKSLGKSMAKIKEIVGGAILGNGDIALILNVDGIGVDHKAQDKGATIW